MRRDETSLITTTTLQTPETVTQQIRFKNNTVYAHKLLIIIIS